MKKKSIKSVFHKYLRFLIEFSLALRKNLKYSKNNQLNTLIKLHPFCFKKSPKILNIQAVFFSKILYIYTKEKKPT